MAELARWQWDDAGTWRDFAEQYQAQMEAAYQRRERSVELAIPPFGTFKMDLQSMTQITVRGRNPGYEREIRRQVRKIELGYFLLGYEGEICSSDSLVDRMEETPVVEKLAKVLRRICDEPEEFSFRSLNLVDDEFRDNLGNNDEAQQFLEELGFELIEEGPECFMVFMQEQVDGLRGALKDVEARLKKLGVNPVESNAVCESNASESNNVVESNNVESNAVSSKVGPDETIAKGKENRSPMQEVASPGMCPATSPWDAPASCEVSVVLQTGERHELKLPGDAALEDFLRELKVVLPNMRLPCLKRQEQQEQWPRLEATVSGGKSKKRKGAGKGKGKSGKGSARSEPKPDAGQSLESADPVMHQVPMLEMSLASEPGILLWRACPHHVTARDAAGNKMQVPADSSANVRGFPSDLSSAKPVPAEPVLVEDFEEAFTKRLQTGLLRLRDMASVAPLLDWEKPELPKMLTGRVKSLLEGSCAAWCKAAGGVCEDELLCARALLRRVYGSLALDERLRICRELLPPEKRDRKAKLDVDRGEDFLKNTFTGLMKMGSEELRNPLSIRFVGEVAEDYGGPRRDFFCLIGTRLCSDLKALWRRLPTGALAPVPDAVAEVSPKDNRAGLDEVEEAYRACGRAAGLAVKYGDVLGEEFAGFFVYQVARDDTVGLEELQRQIAESEGSDDFRASRRVLESHVSESGIKGLKLTRTRTGTDVEVELVPGGHDLEVTEENKADWLRLHLHDKLYRSMQKAADAFRTGILDIWGGSRRTCPLLVLLTPAELVRIWAGSGVTDADVRRWKEVATVSDEVKTQAGWLWEILEEADEAYRSKVLKFTTGVHRIGYVGIQSFEVQPADGQDESLPRAMTCANMLQMPRYSSKERLSQQLQKATELCDGFQIL
mmetsp:Transcript_39647/g.91618  ORF Transcript_39647/g.91618 Transcript_39647/m.91618 type:complete len:896 (-) Transcript_39647:70-2757(-)